MSTPDHSSTPRPQSTELYGPKVTMANSGFSLEGGPNDVLGSTTLFKKRFSQCNSHRNNVKIVHYLERVKSWLQSL